MRWLLALMLSVLTLGLAAPAAAHLTPNSELVLDFGHAGVTMRVIIPEGDYYAAAGLPAVRDTARAQAWLAGQVAVRSAQGAPWRVDVADVHFAQVAGPPDLFATIRLTPPPGASARRFSLHWSAVVGQNPDHFALILVGNDHDGGVLRDDRRLIGAVRGTRQDIMVDRGQPSALAAFAATFRLGVKHIAEGVDHLLFLLSLLLPAPLLAHAGRHRWNGPRPLGSAVGKLAGTITAFTIGHSLTLIIAALGAWTLPVQPVEVAIAVSILVAAIHAIRPLFAGREMWVAGGFGLIHGLAFATLIGDAGVGGPDRLLAILGFNLGIEAVQLAVAGCAMVPLMLLARTPLYTWVRLSGGVFAAVAAIGWVAERTTGIGNPVADAMPMVAAQAPVLLGVLVVLALGYRLLQRQRSLAA